MVKGLKRLSDIPVISQETMAAMVQDAKSGMGLYEFNSKYPEYRMNDRQYDYFLLRIRRGDKM